MTRRALVLLVAALACACGAGRSSWPEDVGRYVPGQIDGVEVDEGSPFAASLASSIAGGGDGQRVTAAVGGPSAEDPAPRQVLLALGGDRDEVDRVSVRLEGDLLADAARDEANQIEGVEVVSGTLDQGGRRIAFASARPRAEVLVVVLAFTGGSTAARETMEEALTGAKG